MFTPIRHACVILVAATLPVLLSSSAAQTHAPTESKPRTFDLLTATIADIQDAVDAGALTYERLVHLYLDRIDAYDKNGPRLNAVIAINPRAAEIARSLDEERR